MTWISSVDRLPENDSPVLVCVGVAPNRRILRAIYAAKFVLEANLEANEDAEYSEEDDTYYCRPGWYEQNEYDEVSWRIDDSVTHWMPLPGFPEATKSSQLLVKWQRYVHPEVNEYSATTQWLEVQKMHVELMTILPTTCQDVLDLGCGDGWSTNQLRVLGKNVMGVTINQQEAEYARTTYHLDLVVCDMHDLPLPDQSFDAIYCRESYEHAIAPYIALCEMNRVLRMNGYVLLNIPWEGWVREDSHFSVFTPSQMREMFYKCQFVVEQEGHSSYGHFWYLARKVAEIGQPHPFGPPVPGKLWLNGQVQ